ncbi:class I adenylate-forming enzyme family protein [Paraburkholderia megapolitana]|uniref:Acyl-CoA synthetase (AMP-forming)/AMP-acid ligase II n=1 Tax=Paraburkholderia megapolitana TaxID=420953 RepID=A0A1I3MS25_9BURK|nr:fatty acid--CoA ligase family protein [Paraburkholderia megapolitana]QDQ84107.1 long-chain fatty acid--CoA ligase [Paraburkholderia megapolitana]SFI99525.1 Acyl-CoA synthetase (AMP-forming)/AMP-acid ligase II [Paraburkholderia megapolitana]
MSAPDALDALDILDARFADAGDAVALVIGGDRFTYAQLRAEVRRVEQLLAAESCTAGTVALVADYSLQSVAYLLALWRLRNVVALLSGRQANQERELIRLAEAGWEIRVDAGKDVELTRTGVATTHALLTGLGSTQEPGFIIFSSGSTGSPKASVHRATPFLDRHIAPKRCLRSISFLLFDHIGGLNTLLYVLFNQGTLVVPASRRPEVVAQAIETQRVQALTTSPTFLNLLIFSGALERFDLGSLQVVNYGTEPMPERVLERLTAALPATRFSQAYGLTETGVVPTRSESSTSNWLKIGGEGCDVRVVDGLLEIRSETTMLGYLNAENPFTADGYFKTGDAVVQKGDHFRIVGRQSDLINVGGEKVYPAEIEQVLKDVDGVIDVMVSRAEHPLVGHMVAAIFRLTEPEPLETFRQRLYAFCLDRLPAARIPRKIRITTEPLHGERFKKMRTPLSHDSLANEEA